MPGPHDKTGVPWPVVDAHCHGGPGDGFRGPWDTDAPLGPYAERAARAGIAHTLVWPPFHTDYARANEVLAQLIAPHRIRFSGVAFVHAGRDRGRVYAIAARAVRVHGFRAIKCHRYDARLTREVCEAARALAVPIVYDPMGEVDTVELAAPEYRTVDFLIPHLGSFADDWGRQRAFLDILARHPNVYTDTSGVRRFDLLVEAVERAGAHKVLFGSDGPWLHPGVELAKVRELRLPPESQRLVEGGNALRLFALRRGAGAPVPRDPSASPPARSRRIISPAAFGSARPVPRSALLADRSPAAS